MSLTTENTKSTEAATPETDEAQHEGLLRGNPMPTKVVTANFARKLERERDEARADLKFRRELYKVLEGANNHFIAVNEEVAKLARVLKQERDEARENLRILAGLVAYGLGQSGEEWSLDAMRQATAAIQNAKALEDAK